MTAPVLDYHKVLVALVRDHGQRHAVHGAVRRHDEHRARVVLAGGIADVAICLDEVRTAEASLLHPIKQHLRELAQAQNAHARVLGMELGHHERDAYERVLRVDEVAFTILPHRARLLSLVLALAHEGLLVRSRHNGHAIALHPVAQVVCQQRLLKRRVVEHDVEREPH